uniref:Phage protein n=2 Tax=Strongyloides stercoralis TaxID=6248 RepID=A0A0K0EQG8_STRER
MADLTVIELKKKLDRAQQTYDTHMNNYKQWLDENKSLEGSDVYVQYCQNVEKWEKDILERIVQITKSYEQALTKSFSARAAEMTAVPSAAKIDIELRNLVHTIKPMEFMMAIINYGHADPQFLNHVVQIVNAVDAQRNRKTGESQKQHPLVNGVFFAQSNEGYSTQNVNYRVEPPIKKPTYTPAPQKQYTMGNIMPFSDFSHH